jgi:sugar/nucleoside kinase (ribokinase family)
MRTLCLGEALVDLVCEHAVDSPAQADAFVPRFGGDVANAAVTAARLGADIALAGGAGDDAWGTWLRGRLAAEGVGLEWFGLLAGVRTPIAFVTVDGGGEPTFVFYGDAIAPAVRAAAPRLSEAVTACDALFLTSNTLLGEQERMLALTARRQALDEGRHVVVDANLRAARWTSPDAAVATVQGCVPGVALLKCNRSEAQALTGRDDPAAAAGALLELGARSVVVTLGPDGALLRGAGGDRDVPGVPASPVDTTGAGDAITGVLLARLTAAEFDPAVLPEALGEAVQAAARVTEQFGAIADRG